MNVNMCECVNFLFQFFSFLWWLSSNWLIFNQYKIGVINFLILILFLGYCYEKLMKTFFCCFSLLIMLFFLIRFWRRAAGAENETMAWSSARTSAWHFTSERLGHSKKSNRQGFVKNSSSRDFKRAYRYSTSKHKI